MSKNSKLFFSIRSTLKRISNTILRREVGPMSAHTYLCIDTVQLHIDFRYHILPVLVDEALCALVESFDSGVGPPAMEVAFAVEQATLVVKAVGDFMP